jgi:hypothetical protein
MEKFIVRAIHAYTAPMGNTVADLNETINYRPTLQSIWAIIESQGEEDLTQNCKV